VEISTSYNEFHERGAASCLFSVNSRFCRWK